MTTDARRLTWDGCSNTRHLGGFSGQDGRLTREAALIRSDNLARLTAQGQERLIGGGVATIIDLRSGYELQIEANPFAGQVAPQYHHLPLMNDSDEAAMQSIGSAASPLEMYQVMLEHFKDNIATIMRTIADAPTGGAVVVHCHVGKDRTGLVVALLLRLAGVAAVDIAEDYALSDSYLQAFYQELLSHKTDPEERAALARLLTSKPETMIGMLDYLEQRYGSAEGYLRACGLEDQELERLKARMVG